MRAGGAGGARWSDAGVSLHVRGSAAGLTAPGSEARGLAEGSCFLQPLKYR